MKERTVWTVLSGPTGTTTTKSLTVSLGQNDLRDDGKSIRNQLEERASSPSGPGIAWTLGLS
jgi:hypothetical protein